MKSADIARIPILLLLALAAACASAPPSPATSPADRAIDPALALATFDTVWNKVRVNHYDSTFGGLDWNAVRTELRPKAASARTVAGLRRILSDMIGRIGASHYTLIPSESYHSLDPERSSKSDGSPHAPADAGIELRAAGNDLVVWRVDSAGPALTAGVHGGDVVIDIDGYQPGTALRQLRALPLPRERQLALTRFLYAVNRLVQGESGDTVRLRLRDGRGRETARTVPLSETRGQLVGYGNLPPTIARVHWQRVSGDGCIGVIAWNIWMTPIAAAIDSAVDALRDCRGIVLDLRGNPGGVAGMVMGIGGHFVDTVRALGTLRMRTGELRFVTNPRRVNARGEKVDVFRGPLAILMDEMSASTSEVFAGGMQAIHRARIFGGVSAGQALPALMVKLPDDDVLLHAVADYIVVDGTRPEGRGVIPDEPIAFTVADALAGRDAALEAALRWIGGARR